MQNEACIPPAKHREHLRANRWREFTPERVGLPSPAAAQRSDYDLHSDIFVDQKQSVIGSASSPQIHSFYVVSAVWL